MDLSGYTPHQQLALVKACTGSVPPLKPYDQLVQVMVTPTRCGVTVRRFHVKERATETLLTSAKIVMMAWDLQDDESWKFGSLEIEDGDFKQPLIWSHRGGKTLEEWRDRNYHEALCYRPGNGTRFGQRDHTQVQRETDREYMKVNNVWD